VCTFLLVGLLFVHKCAVEAGKAALPTWGDLSPDNPFGRVILDLPVSLNPMDTGCCRGDSTIQGLNGKSTLKTVSEWNYDDGVSGSITQHKRGGRIRRATSILC